MSQPHPLLQNPLPRSLQGLSGALDDVYTEIGTIQKRLGTPEEQSSDFQNLRDLVHRYSNAMTGFITLKSMGLSEVPVLPTEVAELARG